MLKKILAYLILLTLQGCSDDHRYAMVDEVRAVRATDADPAREWRHYLGDKGSSQSSVLRQVNRQNVANLQEVWRYEAAGAGRFDTLIPTNPLIVNGVLYGLDARKNLFALNAATGQELWLHVFDMPFKGKGSGRGLVYWEGTDTQGNEVDWIVVGLGHQLFAVHALTGRTASSFGDNGVIDLRVGLDRPAQGLSVNVIAPGTLYGDLLIQGFGTSEFHDAAPGYIRAYHIPSGDLRWTFRTIPAANEAGADTWPAATRGQIGGANSWAGITVDEDRGIAFVPTGSAAYDFYGANRKGDNLYANSLLALNAATGERLWHYQFVRHDLWDRDLPTPPNLIYIEREGQRIPAVAQATKSGHVFVFHRETGEPLFPMTEVAVSGAGVPGEHVPATQPLPSAPPPFANQRFEVSTVTAASYDYITELIADMAIAAPYHAPDERGVVVYPGLDGGAQWGGQAYDRSSGLLYINTNEVPWYFKMVPSVAEGGLDIMSTEFAYLQFCGACHGADRAGNGQIFPSLQNIGDKYWPWEVYSIARHGRGRMPAFTTEPWYYLAGAIAYLYTAADDEIAQRHLSGEITGYMADGFRVLLDEHKLPGSKPPWGSLVAMDVNRGNVLWKIPLGDYPQALAMGLSELGAENYGGPVVTAGGLVFIGATPDAKLRAFDKTSGQLLWQTTLPAAGFATPAIYEVDGRQFIVIAAGGGRLDQPSGNTYIAYALPP